MVARIKIAPAAAAVAAAFAALSVAAPAFANEITVNYKDLDLSTAKGQNTLARRIVLVDVQLAVTYTVLVQNPLRQCHERAREAA